LTPYEMAYADEDRTRVRHMALSVISRRFKIRSLL
jgi:hypothetical protein